MQINFDKKRIEQFIRVGKTKSSDVLQILGSPTSKGIYSDGRTSYLYSQGATPPNIRLATFIFGSSGLLEEWKYDENFQIVQRSKFSHVVDSGNAELNQAGVMIGHQYEEFSLGASSGRIFATCGKPFHAQDEGIFEKWIYKDADNPDVHYYFYFDQNVLKKKYWVKMLPFDR